MGGRYINNFRRYIPPLQNLSYIEKYYRLYELRPTIGQADRHHFSAVLFGRLVRAMTDPASLSLQITRCCPRKSRYPLAQTKLFLSFSATLPLSLFGRRPTLDDRVKTFELFMFFSASPQLQCGMQMHLLFCRPFECLMSARRQNCVLPPLSCPRITTLSFLSLSVSFCFSSGRSASHGRSKAGHVSVNDVKKTSAAEEREEEDEEDEIP